MDMIKCLLIFLFALFILNLQDVYAQTVILENITNVDNIGNGNQSAIDKLDISIKQIQKKEWWIYLLAIVLILIATLISHIVIKRARKSNLEELKRSGTVTNTDELYKGGFWDIIREGDYFPSLARFQFFVWTFVISFTLLSAYFILLRNGILNPTIDIPTNTLLLMGISTAVPVISNIISKTKYTETLSSIPKKEEVPKLSTMLLEGGKPTLGRFQMFLWTILSISVYLLQFSNYFNQEYITTIIPDVDDSLVVLMGLSQAGYLGFKQVARKRSYQ